MKWYQHSVDSHEDPDISDAEDLFGDAGYNVFFKILEIYGREYNRLNDNGELDISKSKLCRNLRKKWKKIEVILNFYHKKGRIILVETQNQPRTNPEPTQNQIKMAQNVLNRNEERVIIKIPKFIDLSSNWTKRQHYQPTEVTTEAPTEAPTAIEVEVEVEEKKEIYKESVTFFDLFYKKYPKKIARAKCLKKWLGLFKGKSNEKAQILNNEIMVGLNRYIQYWIDNNIEKEFIPHPLTWLSQARWKDEISGVKDRGDDYEEQARQFKERHKNDKEE